MDNDASPHILPFGSWYVYSFSPLQAGISFIDRDLLNPRGYGMNQ